MCPPLCHTAFKLCGTQLPPATHYIWPRGMFGGCLKEAGSIEKSAFQKLPCCGHCPREERLNTIPRTARSRTHTQLAMAKCRRPLTVLQNCLEEPPFSVSGNPALVVPTCLMIV
jgi:hypothetical protein